MSLGLTQHLAHNRPTIQTSFSILLFRIGVGRMEVKIEIDLGVFVTLKKNKWILNKIMLLMLIFSSSFYFCWIVRNMTVSTAQVCNGVYPPAPFSHHSYWVFWPFSSTLCLVPDFTPFKVGVLIQFYSRKGHSTPFPGQLASS